MKSSLHLLLHHFLHQLLISHAWHRDMIAVCMAVRLNSSLVSAGMRIACHERQATPPSPSHNMAGARFQSTHSLPSHHARNRRWWLFRYLRHLHLYKARKLIPRARFRQNLHRHICRWHYCRPWCGCFTEWRSVPLTSWWSRPNMMGNLSVAYHFIWSAKLYSPVPSASW